MAGEKNFENRLKDWLESEGIYPLGHPEDKMTVPPCGYLGKALGWRPVCEKRPSRYADRRERAWPLKWS